tara:strand:- start:168 stop:329 length:162 start_codon:yes stop_codon:yes gene_type:complete
MLSYKKIIDRGLKVYGKISTKHISTPNTCKDYIIYGGLPTHIRVHARDDRGFA